MTLLTKMKDANILRAIEILFEIANRDKRDVRTVTMTIYEGEDELTLLPCALDILREEANRRGIGEAL